MVSVKDGDTHLKPIHLHSPASVNLQFHPVAECDHPIHD
jgi:hypothetical protein